MTWRWARSPTGSQPVFQHRIDNRGTWAGLTALNAYPEGTMSRRLTTQQRKEIFLSLVETQDQGNNVRKSYEDVTERFEISEDQLKLIEEEGLDNEWPPLCEAAPNSM